VTERLAAALPGLVALDEDLRPSMPHRVGDRPGDVEHTWRIRVAAIERAVPRALGRQPDQLGQVLRRGRVEATLAPIDEHDQPALVEHALDEMPLTRERRARPVDRPWSDDRRAQVVLPEQDLLDR